MRAEAREDLAPRDNGIGRPSRGAADIHVFDEAQFGADACGVSISGTSSSSLTPRMTTVSSFSEAKPAAAAAAIPSSTCVQIVSARERAESSGSQRVEADRDAVQSGRAQGCRIARASRTPLVVIARSRSPAARRVTRSSTGKIAAEERFPSGDPDAVDAERRKRVDDRVVSSNVSRLSRGSQT